MVPNLGHLDMLYKLPNWARKRIDQDSGVLSLIMQYATSPLPQAFIVIPLKIYVHNTQHRDPLISGMPGILGMQRRENLRNAAKLKLSPSFFHFQY